MFEVTIGDQEMLLLTVQPDGPIDGIPQWSVVSGNGTLLGDPAVWDPGMVYPEVHQAWTAGGLAEGFQMFVVSDTLPDGEPGPLSTGYAVQADVDLGTGVMTLTEPIVLHVINRTTTLGIMASVPIQKPTPLP